MKIYSEDGKEFQSVEACEEYENSLKNLNGELQKRLESFVKEYISSHLYAEVVITRDNESHYMIALHDNYEQAMLLPTVMIAYRYGKRVKISGRILKEKYRTRTLTKEDLNQLCEVVYDFFVSTNFDTTEYDFDFSHKGYNCYIDIHLAEEFIKTVVKIHREMWRNAKKFEAKNTNTNSGCVNGNNVRFAACSSDDFFNFIEDMLNIH